MTTPFAHAHVAHLVRMGRRRSRSLNTTKAGGDDTPGQSNQRKEFLAQLKKEGQKYQKNRAGQNEEKEEKTDDEDDNHVVVSKIARAHTMSTKKHTTLTGIISTTVRKEPPPSVMSKTAAQSDDEEFQPVVTRVRTNTMTSNKKHTPSKSAMAAASRNEVSSVTSVSVQTQEDEQHRPQVTRIPQLETKTSLQKQISTTTCKSSNVDVFTTSKNLNSEPSTTSNGLYLDFSHGSNPLHSSSTQLMSKSEMFDQEFHLDDDKSHIRRNDVKGSGSINISGREKQYNTHKRRLPTNSSAGFMAAIIAIIIGVIAFAFGLTALILVLLLRSTVNSSLATNSTSSGSSASSSGGSGTLPSSCSAYTTIEDPTRSVSAPGYALGCDNTPPFNQSTPVWLRFIGTGGSTLPLTTPGLNLCGSTGTGWYDGDMPSSSGEVVNGTVCFTWIDSVCRYSVSISVANCASFYIYLLPPAPACMMRYCTI